MEKRETKEPQNQLQIDMYREKGPARVGPWTSHIRRNDSRHLGFVPARNIFCTKLPAAESDVPEIGCGGAFGTMFVLQTVKSVHGVGFEPLVIDDNRVRLAAEGLKNCSFAVNDMTESPPDMKHHTNYYPTAHYLRGFGIGTRERLSR